MGPVRGRVVRVWVRVWVWVWVRVKVRVRARVGVRVRVRVVAYVGMTASVKSAPLMDLASSIV